MTKWSDWHNNPFEAIREIAQPGDYAKAIEQLARSATWDNWDAGNYLDDLLQEVAGATNIVCQYRHASEGKAFRAAYDR